ncbi:helix-turn-helix domain-containing protein [Bradyrhizobium genosp. P]|uniref:helix-turn-helix domain-containing protein n=1 Tax=Bradyrhizobium genosp. P TaxID=83641 RepID=UPI003CE846FC
MDVWDFKKWRKKLGYSQVAAGEKLGLSRGAVQYWESEIRPIPLAIELACRELLRQSKLGQGSGRVTLLYADAPISQEDPPCGNLVLRRERHPNNESALNQVVRLREAVTLFMPLIVEDDRTVIWSGPELLHECDARKQRAELAE